MTETEHALQLDDYLQRTARDTALRSVRRRLPRVSLIGVGGGPARQNCVTPSTF